MGGVCTDACYNFVARCFRASSFLTGTCPSHFSRKRQWAMFIQTSSRVLVYSAGLSTLWYSMGFFLLGRCSVARRRSRKKWTRRLYLHLDTAQPTLRAHWSTSPGPYHHFQPETLIEVHEAIAARPVLAFHFQATSTC